MLALASLAAHSAALAEDDHAESDHCWAMHLESPKASLFAMGVSNFCTAGQASLALLTRKSQGPLYSPSSCSEHLRFSLVLAHLRVICRCLFKALCARCRCDVPFCSGIHWWCRTRAHHESTSANSKAIPSALLHGGGGGGVPLP